MSGRSMHPTKCYFPPKIRTVPARSGTSADCLCHNSSPWPQYPRPLLERSQWQSLNGVWAHQNVSSLDAVNSPPTNETLTNAVLVPSCLESGLSGEWREDNEQIEIKILIRVCRCNGYIHAIQLVSDILHSSFELDRGSSAPELWIGGL